MQGLMMDFPLTLTSILERARRLFPARELVSRSATGIRRRTYAEFYRRVCRMAGAFRSLGVGPGDRIATLGWNTIDHLEVYFAAPCYGAVLHTLNIRLLPEQISYIANHAGDSVVFVDQNLLPLLERFRREVSTIRHIVVMNEEHSSNPSFPVLHYEGLISDFSPSFDWPSLDENTAAAMCYTSGTTGKPKGCLYSHRALVLHSMALSLADVFGICQTDTVMPVVPMFHVNAWGLPFAATMAGAKQVFPGPNLQPGALAELIEHEGVTVAAGVPTIWIALLRELEHGSYDVSRLRICPCGGAALPRGIIESYWKNFGVRVCHAWGMTETSPLGTVSRLRNDMSDLPEKRKFDILALQGAPVPGIDVRAVGADGNEVPHDGRSLGELQVRGPWVIREYFDDPRSPEHFADGWFRTGDVVTIDPNGYMKIADRTKDLVKSGGEWISSVDLELAIMGHPQVLEAAVVAVPHETWQERPLACVVPKPEFRGVLTADPIREFLYDKVPGWWIPEGIVFLESIPKTSVGKFDKKQLRATYGVADTD